MISLHIAHGICPHQLHPQHFSIGFFRCQRVIIFLNFFAGAMVSLKKERGGLENPKPVVYCRALVYIFLSICHSAHQVSLSGLA